MDTRKAVVTYNRDTDTLYITLPPCKGGFADSSDGKYFFAFYDSHDSETPSAFEVHWFSEVWDDDDLIPEVNVRFDVEDTDLRGVTLRELLAWAHQRFVEARMKAEV